MIQDDEFGALGSARLLHALAGSSGYFNRTDILAGYLPELRGIELRNALKAASQQIHLGKDQRLLWESMMSRDDLSQSELQLLGPITNSLASGMNTEDLRNLLSDDNPRKVEAAAQALAARLASKGETDFKAELESTPEGARNAMALGWLTHPMPKSSKASLAALNQLIDDEQWTALTRKEVSSGIGSFANDMGELELADWVSKLPPRDETVKFFHQGVKPFIKRDPQAALEWMSGMDAGTWRDRAFAEYSQQMLYQFNDPEASRKALEQIQNTDFKATAEGWRAGWEQQQAP